MMSGHLSWPIMSTEYHTDTTETRHTSLIVSYIDQFNLTNDVMMIQSAENVEHLGSLTNGPLCGNVIVLQHLQRCNHLNWFCSKYEHPNPNYHVPPPSVSWNSRCHLITIL